MKPSTSSGCAAAIADDQPDRFAYLSNLSLTLRSAYDRLRVRRDLDEAIKTGRTAVQGIKVGDGPGGVWI